jgi:hypothetical protein
VESVDTGKNGNFLLSKKNSHSVTLYNREGRSSSRMQTDVISAISSLFWVRANPDTCPHADTCGATALVW